MFSFSTIINTKIRILLFHYNCANFIELQCKLFKKFLKDDYEIIVLNDSPDSFNERTIERMCNKLQIRHVRFPQKLHNDSNLARDIINNWHDDFPLFTATTSFPLIHLKNSLYGAMGVRHCNVIRYALENFGYDFDGTVVLLEGDVFLIREFSIREYCKDYDIVGNFRVINDLDTTSDMNYELEYLWPGVSFINFVHLQNKKSLIFDICYIKNFIADTGGSSFNYFQNNSSVKVKKHYTLNSSRLARLNHEQLKAMNFNEREINLIRILSSFNCYRASEFHIDNCFFHYSSKWFADEKKENKVLSFLNELLITN